VKILGKGIVRSKNIVSPCLWCRCLSFTCYLHRYFIYFKCLKLFAFFKKWCFCKWDIKLDISNVHNVVTVVIMMQLLVLVLCLLCTECRAGQRLLCCCYKMSVRTREHHKYRLICACWFLYESYTHVTRYVITDFCIISWLVCFIKMFSCRLNAVVFS